MSGVYTKAFKLSAVARMGDAGNVSALAEELGVHRNQLYRWRKALGRGGPDGLRTRGRPRRGVAKVEREGLAAARQRIAELERRLGQQALELDFFRRALRQVEALRQPSDRPGATASTPSSRR